MFYQDRFGVQVVGIGSSLVPTQPLPEYLKGDDQTSLLVYMPLIDSHQRLFPTDWNQCVEDCLNMIGGIPRRLLPRGQWRKACEWTCSRLFPKPKPPPSQPPAPTPPAPRENDCPEGTCAYRCPGVDKVGCAPPGTKVECPDGTKLTLPEDCARKTAPLPSP